MSKGKVVHRRGYRVTVQVEIEVTRSEAGGSEAALRRALKGADVKVKSGPLENLAMGTVTAVKLVEPCKIKFEESV